MHKRKQTDTQMCVIRLTIGARERKDNRVRDGSTDRSPEDSGGIPAARESRSSLSWGHWTASRRHWRRFFAAGGPSKSSPPLSVFKLATRHSSRVHFSVVPRARRFTHVGTLFLSRIALLPFFLCSIFSRFFSSKRAEGLRPVHLYARSNRRSWVTPRRIWRFAFGYDETLGAQRSWFWIFVFSCRSLNLR